MATEMDGAFARKLDKQWLGYLAIGLVVVLLFPYIVLASRFGFATSIPMSDFIWALKNTFYQSLLSTLLSLILGLIGAVGLIGWWSQLKAKHYAWIELFCILPSFLPTLFVIVSVMKVVDPFPFGVFGIAIVHAVIYSGVVAVALSRIIQNKILGMSELAIVEGARFWPFFRVAVLGYLKRDILFVSLFVLASTFASFSIPLAVGGTSGTTLEVLTYESITIKGNWGEAISLSLIQTLIVFILALLPAKSVGEQTRGRGSLKLIARPSFIFVPALISLGCVFPILLSLSDGYAQLSAISFQFTQFFMLWLQSVLIAASVGLMVALFFTLLVMCFDNKWLNYFMRSYLAPSSVLIGFAFLIFPGFSQMPFFFRVACAVSLALIPALCRLGLVQKLDSLRGQVLAAQTLGANSSLIFSHILLPQMLGTITHLSGLAAFWGIGDFAFSSIVSAGESNLSLLVYSLMGNYRINAALTLTVPLLISAGILYALFIGVRHVIGRKPIY